MTLTRSNSTPHATWARAQSVFRSASCFASFLTRNSRHWKQGWPARSNGSSKRTQAFWRKTYNNIAPDVGALHKSQHHTTAKPHLGSGKTALGFHCRPDLKPSPLLGTLCAKYLGADLSQIGMPRDGRRLQGRFRGHSSAPRWGGPPPEVYLGTRPRRGLRNQQGNGPGYRRTHGRSGQR